MLNLEEIIIQRKGSLKDLLLYSKIEQISIYNAPDEDEEDIYESPIITILDKTETEFYLIINNKVKYIVYQGDGIDIINNIIQIHHFVGRFEATIGNFINNNDNKDGTYLMQIFLEEKDNK